jgi:hypothetical protein
MKDDKKLLLEVATKILCNDVFILRMYNYYDQILFNDAEKNRALAKEALLLASELVNQVEKGTT